MTSSKGHASFLLMGFGMWLFAWSLAWLMPNHYPPWVGFHAEAMAVAGGMIFLGASLAYLRRHAISEIGMSAALRVAVVITVLPLLWHALGRSAFLSDAVLGFFYLAMLAMAALLARAVCNAPPPEAQSLPMRQWLLEAVAGVCLFVGIVSWGIAMSQWLRPYAGSMFITDLAAGERPYGNFAQPNQFATFMLMACASAVYLFERDRLGRLAFSLSMGVCLLSVTMSQSRTGALSVLGLMTWAAWASYKKSVRTPVRVFTALLALFVVLWINWAALLDLLQLVGARGEGQLTERARPIIWGQMMAAIIDRPMWGFGWHGVSAAQFAVARGFDPVAYTNFSHNLFLDLMVWFGAPMGLLLSSVCLVWSWRRICASCEPETWYCLAALLPLAVHSMLEYPFAYAEFLLPAGIFFGVLEASQPDACRLRVPANFLWGVTALLATYALLFGIEYFRVEQDYRTLRMNAAKIGEKKFSLLYAEPILLGQLGAKVALYTDAITAHMSPEALDHMRRTALQYPETPLLYRYAKALLLNGQVEESARVVQTVGLLHSPLAQRQIESALAADLDMLNRQP